MIVAAATTVATDVGLNQQHVPATGLDACQMLPCKHNLGDKCRAVLVAMHTADWFSLSGILPSSQ